MMLRRPPSRSGDLTERPAGAECAFTNNWIGRLEYRFYDLGNSSLDNFGDVELHINTLTHGIA